MKQESKKWKPLASDKLEAIRTTFARMLPVSTYDDLAAHIADYWISKLYQVWENKPLEIKDKDERYLPSDPLSRIQQ